MVGDNKQQQKLGRNRGIPKTQLGFVVLTNSSPSYQSQVITNFQPHNQSKGIRIN
jgi:hypothetical protein